MNENINLCEILKDCPKGMELDCTIWDNVKFDHINMKSDYPIHIKKPGGQIEYLTENGCFNFDLGAKCVIFPKGKTTWKGFRRPFKDGDIVATHDGKYIAIIKNDSKYYVCCHLNSNYFHLDQSGWFDRLATEEEKQKLFQVFKDRGYKWNDQLKRLEVLITPNFKIGDIIQDKDSYKVKITNVNIEDRFYTYESLIAKGIGTITFNDQHDWELMSDDIKPKFKIGDRIKHKLTGEICIVLFVLSNGNGGGVYDVAITNEIGKSIDVKDQDDWELVEYQVGDHFINPSNNSMFVITKIQNNGNYSVESLGEIYYPFEMKKLDVDRCTKINKWNPKRFKPFDKVLTRDTQHDSWVATLFSHIGNSEEYPYVTTYVNSRYCIPYNSETEHLVGTTLEEPEFYKL